MFDNAADNPTSLHLAAGDERGTDFAAGAAVGNALLAAAVGALSHAVAAVAALAVRHSAAWPLAASAVLPSLPAPGALVGPYGVLVQPAVAACAALLYAASGGGTALGVAILAAWLAVPSYVAWELRRGRGHACGGPFALRTAAPEPTVLSSGPLVRGARYLLEPTEVWVLPRRGRARWEGLEAAFGAYVAGREWYVLVEWALSVVSGAVLGVAQAVSAVGSDADSACVAADMAAWTGVALGALQVLLVATLRPAQIRFEIFVSALGGALSLTSQALVLGNMIDAAADVVLASVVELATMALMVLREALTGIHGARWLRGADPGEVNFENLRNSQMYSLVELICKQQRRKNNNDDQRSRH